MINTIVRCFRLLHDGKPCTTRRGVWLMTRSSGRRGVFFHGDREEVQGPRYTVEELSEMSVEELTVMKIEHHGLHVHEISPKDALKELESWPAAKKEAVVIFNRHLKEGEED